MTDRMKEHQDRFDVHAEHSEAEYREEIQLLRNALGNALFNATSARIGHDQLNRMIGVAIIAGAPKHFDIEAQVKWMRDQIRAAQ